MSDANPTTVTNLNPGNKTGRYAVGAQPDPQDRLNRLTVEITGLDPAGRPALEINGPIGLLQYMSVPGSALTVSGRELNLREAGEMGENKATSGTPATLRRPYNSHAVFDLSPSIISNGDALELVDALNRDVKTFQDLKRAGANAGRGTRTITP